MEQGRCDEGISLEQRVLALVPTFASAFNDIGLMQFIKANWKRPSPLPSKS